MKKRELQYFWEADAKLKILESPGLALSVQTIEKKSEIKKEKFYEFTFSEWLSKDGKVMFDVGKRLRGWIRAQAKTVRPSLAEALQYGVRCLSKPHPGSVEIGEVSELEGEAVENVSDDMKRMYRMPSASLTNPGMKMDFPRRDAFTVGSGRDLRSIFSFYYTLPKEKTVEVKITSFARNFNPEIARWMLNKFGQVQGIGDRYASGYGLFELLEFEYKSEEIPF